MKSIAINLKLAENVKQFVHITNKYAYDMDLRSGRHVVDAKSILGIFSLDLNQSVVLEIYCDNCEDLISDLSAFM
jgi:phosphotransferase system HPr-like phosphotransfer protein